MSKRKNLTLMDHWHIEMLWTRDRLEPSEIASKLGFSESAIRASLEGRSGLRQREKANRMESMLGGVTKDSGNYRTRVGTVNDGIVDTLEDYD